MVNTVELNSNTNTKDIKNNYHCILNANKIVNHVAIGQHNYVGLKCVLSTTSLFCSGTVLSRRSETPAHRGGGQYKQINIRNQESRSSHHSPLVFPLLEPIVFASPVALLDGIDRRRYVRQIKQLALLVGR